MLAVGATDDVVDINFSLLPHLWGILEVTRLIAL